MLCTEEHSIGPNVFVVILQSPSPCSLFQNLADTCSSNIKSINEVDGNTPDWSVVTLVHVMLIIQL